MGLLVLAVVLWGRALQRGGGAFHRPKASPPSPPTALDRGAARWDFYGAMNSLDSLSDALTEGDWDAAREFFAAFRQAVPNLPSPELKYPDISLALVDFFNFYQVELQRALAAEQANRAIFACNQLERIVWDWRVHLNHPPLPEVGRLHYLSRDLEYWARVGDAEMLQRRAQGLVKTWADLRPVLIDRKGWEVVEEVDALLSRLKRAESMEEYQEVAADIGAVMHRIERLFADIK